MTTRTIAPGGLVVAMNTLQPGDMLVLRGGTYMEPMQFPARTWTQDLWTTIESYPGEKVIIDGHAFQYPLRLGAASWIALRGITFNGSAKVPYKQNGAQTGVDRNNLSKFLEFTDLEFTDFYCNALGAYCSDSKFIRVNAHHNGVCGMKILGPRNLIEDCETSDNSIHLDRFEADRIALGTSHLGFVEAGGMKNVGGITNDCVVRGHKAFRNVGPGIWFDWMNSGVTIEDSVTAYNTMDGMFIEVGQDYTVRRNRSFGNGFRGVYAANSQDVTIEDNDIFANGIGVSCWDDPNRAPTDPLHRSQRNVVRNNRIYWNVKAISMPSTGTGHISGPNSVVDGLAPADVAAKLAAKDTTLALNTPTEQDMTAPIAWPAVPGATSYAIQIDTTNPLSSADGGLVAESYALPGPSYELTAAPGTYYYRWAAKINGVLSAWSPITSVVIADTTPPPPASPPIEQQVAELKLYAEKQLADLKRYADQLNHALGEAEAAIGDLRNRVERLEGVNAAFKQALA